MKVTPIKLGGASIVDTSCFKDERGEFARFFCEEQLKEFLKGRTVKQINYSLTVEKGTVRGMHFQYPPKAEVKLVRCLRGSVFDIMVDLRKGSDTFLEWYGEILSGDNMKMLYIPEGFAHGFQTLEPSCEMLYLHTEFYSPSNEGGLRYDDPAVGIVWPMDALHISDRDSKHQLITSDFTGIDV